MQRQVFHMSGRPEVLKSAAVFSTLSLLLISCAAPPPPKTGGPMHQALFKGTGYQLGSEQINKDTAETTSCAVESRYGNKKTGAISRLVCVDRGEGDRIKYRINFTTPDAGHRIWKIDASYPKKKVEDLEIITDFTQKYGAPHKVDNPLMLSWQLESANLSVREDQFGVHLQLWDRGLR